MYLNHPQTSSCPLQLWPLGGHTSEGKGSVCFIFEESLEAPSYTLAIYKPSSSSCIATPPKHATLPTFPADQQTWCTAMAVQSFNETVYKMQSQISILRDKPTMYLNVLLLLNNWEKFKVRKLKKKKKTKKKKHYWLHHISNFLIERLYIHSPTSSLKPVFLL